MLRADWRGACDVESDTVRHWVAAGRPLVVAASRAGDTEGTLRLGLALPDRRRIGLTVAAEAVDRVLGPVRLADVVRDLPAGMQSQADLVLALCPRACVFGSVAWQAMTGLPYLRATSDLDLLCPAGDDPLPLADALAALPALPRLDGEIALPDGRAVAWRELARRPDTVLVKGHGGPWIVPIASVTGAGA